MDIDKESPSISDNSEAANIPKEDPSSKGRGNRRSTRSLNDSNGNPEVGDQQANDSAGQAETESSSNVSGSDSEDEENATPETKELRRKSSVVYATRRQNKQRRNKFSNKPISELKSTQESFVQDSACPSNQFSISNPRLSKCRECREAPLDRARKDRCRFYAFRKLFYSTRALLGGAGFSDPMEDPTEKDLKVWLPSYEGKPTDLDPDMAKFLIDQLGDQFCELLRQELDALRYFEDIKIKTDGEMNNEDDDGAVKMNKITWRRPVANVREMCDACETTLFNYHCTCPKCGFAVCISCFKARQNGNKVNKLEDRQAGRDEYNWFQCSNRRPHELEKMMLSQIIPKNVLTDFITIIHDVRESLGFQQFCCEEGRTRTAKLHVNQFMKAAGAGYQPVNNHPPAQTSLPNTSLSAFKRLHEESSDSEDEDEDEETRVLREFLKRQRTEQELKQLPVKVKVEENPVKEEPAVDHQPVEPDSKKLAFNYVPRQLLHGQLIKRLPPLISSFGQSSLQFPGVPHAWLCNGKLLRLLDPNCEGNFHIFQEVWRRGQPVLVSNVSKQLNANLWSPQSFCEDFGEQKNDLVNCVTGKLVCNQPMKVFWNGFECISKRLRDEKGKLMLLKLKDWPPADDFERILPSRFLDLMSALPLKEYTQRNGRLNLAARLPKEFVPPDLGPKMYIAYGAGTDLDKGTTNLHLDISDAVNLMVYVGVPDGDSDHLETHNAGVKKAILESDCDIFTLERVTVAKELPGALWHIYDARDADKIRDLINKVLLERGIPPKPNHDPIHDQCCYLDKALRQRLKAEYNVIGYPIIQCMGDAVFIPAGAPHQVRNLQNCVKIAEDFVSPENVSHCFRLTEEFRNLSDTHTNHEDKLQIKNIMYHAVKDAVSVVESPVNPPTDVKVEAGVKVKGEPEVKVENGKN